ncbi:MAG: master DNA invertase Mpi family serine-type recombinase [Treponema sp.]
MTYGYIRVSTDRQNVENQRFEINNYCLKKGIVIDSWIEETISGTKSPSRRRLGVLLEKVNKGDKIICSELSRLGRSLLMIMSILNILMEKGVVVYTIKDNYILGDDIQSKVLAFAFGLSAEIERNLISQRTQEALKRKKALGTKLGRPKGRAKQLKLSSQIELTQELLAMRISKAHISRIMGVSVPTLYNFIKRNNLFVPKKVTCNDLEMKPKSP